MKTEKLHSLVYPISPTHLPYHPHQISAQAPEFTRPLADQNIKLGETITLECSVKGLPQPTVEFFSAHDNFKLSTGTRLSIQHDSTNTHWRLVIKEAQASDLREYRAVATNSAGQATSSATIREKQPDAEKPKILDGLKQTKVKGGHITRI